MSNTDYDPSDRLDGARAISDFTGYPLRKTFYLLEKRIIPAGKIGNQYIGSKRKIGETLQAVANGEKPAG